MKIDLDSLSKRFCGAGLLAAAFHEWVSKTPAWIGDYSAITIVAGLVLMLGHEITTRKRKEGQRNKRPRQGVFEII